MSDNTDLTSLTETDLANLCVLCGKLPDDAVDPPCTCDDGGPCLLEDQLADRAFERAATFEEMKKLSLVGHTFAGSELEFAELLGLDPEGEEFVRARLELPGTVSDLYSTLDKLRLHVDNCGPAGHPLCCCGTEVFRGRLFYTCPTCNEQYHKATGNNRDVVA